MESPTSSGYGSRCWAARAVALAATLVVTVALLPGAGCKGGSGGPDDAGYEDAGLTMPCEKCNFTMCNGDCINISSSDNANCGGCGIVCDTSAGQTCEGGYCVCPDLLTLNATNNDCGQCGNKCNSGEVCSNGACKCASGTLDDPSNCGTCGNACPDGQQCVTSGGTSYCTCPGGDSMFNDDANCGTCGSACPSGTHCSGGTCSCGTGNTCAPGSECQAPDPEGPNLGAPSQCCAPGQKNCGGICQTCCTDAECGSDAYCCTGKCTPESNTNCAGCGQPCNTNTCVTTVYPGECRPEGCVPTAGQFKCTDAPNQCCEVGTVCEANGQCAPHCADAGPGTGKPDSGTKPVHDGGVKDAANQDVTHADATSRDGGSGDASHDGGHDGGCPHPLEGGGCDPSKTLATISALKCFGASTNSLVACASIDVINKSTGAVTTPVTTSVDFNVGLAADSTTIFYSAYVVPDGGISRYTLSSVALSGGAVTSFPMASDTNGGASLITIDDTYVYFVTTSQVTPDGGGFPMNVTTLYRMPKTGGTPAPLLGGPNVAIRGAASDGTNVYAIVQGSSASIVSFARTSTSATETTLTTTVSLGASKLKVDANNVYWLDSAGTLLTLPKTGGSPTTDPAWVRDFAVDGTYVYSVDGITNVHKWPIAGGALTTLNSSQGNPQFVAVDGTSVYWYNSADSTIHSQGK